MTGIPRRRKERARRLIDDGFAPADAARKAGIPEGLLNDNPEFLADLEKHFRELTIALKAKLLRAAIAREDVNALMRLLDDRNLNRPPEALRIERVIIEAIRVCPKCGTEILPKHVVKPDQRKEAA